MTSPDQHLKRFCGGSAVVENLSLMLNDTFGGKKWIGAGSTTSGRQIGLL